MGVNYDALSVNKPKCPVHTYHRDGHLRFNENGGATPNYEPNSFGGPMEDPAYKEVAWNLGDSVVGRYGHREGNDDYLKQVTCSA
jgi:catalase